MSKITKRLALILMCILSALGIQQVMAQGSVTVYEGTDVSNQYVPFEGYYGDAQYQHNQYLIPAADLSSANNMELTSMMLYLNVPANKILAHNWTITLVETSATSLGTAYEDVSAGTVVYEGTINWQTTTPTIEFTNAYIYHGGNLLVDFHYSTGATTTSWDRLFFISAAVSGMANYKNGSTEPTSATAFGFAPKTTFTYEVPASCPKPTALVSSNITANSADLAWTAGGSEGNWVIAYTTNSEANLDEVSSVNATTPNVTLTGLSAQTQYYVGIKSLCSATDQSGWLKGTFRTACGTLTLSATESFDESFDGIPNGTGSMPECWTVHRNGENYPYVYSSSYNAHSGDQYLYFGGYSGTNKVQYAVLPEMANNANTLAVSFWMRGYDSNAGRNDSIYVGVMTDPEDPTTFVPVQGFQGAGVYAQYEVLLTTYTGAGHYIAFKRVPVAYQGSYSTSYYGSYIDDVHVEVIPNCYPVQNLTAGRVQRRSFDLSWGVKNGVTCSNFEVIVSEYPLVDIQLNSMAKIQVQDTMAVTITGLTRGTHYYAYVRAVCGADGPSEWVSTEVQTPSLVGVDEQQVGHGTNAGNMPVTNYDYAYTQMIYPASEINHSGTITAIQLQRSSYTNVMNNMKVYLGTTTKSQFASSSDWVAEADLTEVYSGSFAAGTEWLELTLSTPFDYNGTDNLVVAVSNGHGNWNIIQNFFYTSVANSVLVRRSDDAPSYANHPGTASGSNPSSERTNIKFNFAYSLDACPAVTDLNVTDIEQTTATLSWTASTGDYANLSDIYVSTVEITDFTGVTPTYTNVAGTSKQLTGLTAFTDYYVYVRVHCDAEGQNDGNSVWAAAPVFKTLSNCPIPTQFAVTVVGKTRAMATCTAGEQGQTFEYILATDSVVTGTPIASATDTILLIDLVAEQKYYLFLRGVCGEGSESPYICQSFTMPEACPMVTNLTVSDVRFNTVTLSWNRGWMGNESGWVVSNGTTSYNTIDSTIVFFGLQPNTTYTFTVAPSCDHAATQSVVATTAEYISITTIGDGTSTSSGPINSYYGFERNAYIFTPEDGLAAGTINSIAWNFIEADKVIPAKIYLLNTDATDLTSVYAGSWNSAIADATLVYDGTVTTVADWLTIGITGFAYTGQNLMVLVASNYGGAGGASAKAYYTDGATNMHMYSRKDNSFNDDDNLNTASQNGLDGRRHNIRFGFVGGPDCTKPVSNLAVSNLTASSAKISWLPAADETGWKVCVTTDPTVAPESQELPNPSLACSLISMEDDVTYYVYVRSNCDANAEWAMIQFTTPALNVMPTLDSVTHITTSAAQVYFTDNNTIPATGYEVAYGPAATFELSDNTTYTIATITNGGMIQNLTHSTVYKVAVRALGVKASHWSNILTITTECGVFQQRLVETFAPVVPTKPICWDNSEGTTTTESYKWSFYDKTLNNVTYQTVRFNSYNNYRGNTNILKTPEIQLAEYAIMRVAVLNPNGGDLTIRMDSDTLATGLMNIAAWDTLTFPLIGNSTTEPVQFEFVATSNYGNSDAYIYLDYVEVIPTAAPIVLQEVTTYGTPYTAHGFNLNKPVGTYSEYFVENDSIYQLNLTVQAKQLTVEGTSVAAKMYDGTTDAQVTVGAVGGIVNTEDVQVVATGVFADANVGTHNVAVTYGLTGMSQDNYLAPQGETLSATITAKQLTVDSVIVSDKTYDATTQAQATAQLLGVVGTDDVQLIVSAQFTDRNAGAAVPAVVNFQIAGDVTNYEAPDSVIVNAAINHAQLTVTGTTAASKIYDGTTDAQVTLGDVNGLYNDGTQVTATGEFADANAAAEVNVYITYTLTGEAAQNYLPLQGEMMVAAINPAQLTVTGTVVNDKVYDGATDAIVVMGMVDGIVGTDDVQVVADAEFMDVNVGEAVNVAVTYTITGEAAQNYLPLEGEIMTAAITPLTISVEGTEVVIEKDYDATTTAEILAMGELKGVVEGDDVQLIVVASYDDPNPGTDKVITIEYALTGDKSGNYLLDEDVVVLNNCIINEVTYLDMLDAEVKVEKFIRDGQVIIRRGGKEFNAQGAEL